MRVLSVDGGGIRGLIPALVLAEVERRTGRPARELFDLMAGTSTGALIACALAKPDPLPASAVAELYVEDGPRIFSRTLRKRVSSGDGWLDERYDASGLEGVLRRHLGAARLADAEPPVIVTAYDVQARRPVVLRAADDVAMATACRASAAAPAYFEPVRLGEATLVDGGVHATNPSLVAYAEAEGELDVLLSLGTGSHTRPLPYERVRGWGRLEWALPILDVVFDGSADAAGQALRLLLEDDHVRLQTPLQEASDDLDDAGPGNLAALRRDAERLIADRSADLDAVCARLTRARGGP